MKTRVLPDNGWPEFMKLKTAATYVDSSPDTVERLIADGHLKAVKDGGCWKVRRVDLDRYFERLFGGVAA
jgi:excisionase family DNA binding protein